MRRHRSFHATPLAGLEREPRAGDQPRTRLDEAPEEHAGTYLRVCREYEASRLLLAALGQRRGFLE